MEVHLVWRKKHQVTAAQNAQEATDLLLVYICVRRKCLPAFHRTGILQTASAIQYLSHAVCQAFEIDAA